MTPIPLISHDRATDVLMRWAAWHAPTEWAWGWFGGEAGLEWVYFADIGDAFKVGWSHRPLRRVDQLLRCCKPKGARPKPLVFLANCGQRDERRVLTLLGRFRVSRQCELIRKEPAIRDLIGALRLEADACFFDNMAAGYERLPRKCRHCGSYEHNGRNHARLAQKVAA